MNRRFPPFRWLLLVAHVFALVFGLVGLLVMLPNPQLWAHDPRALDIFDFSMKYAGSTHIVLGAAAMAALGVAWIGWRKTAVFFVLATTLSLASELIGTGTGWPFGNYEYTSFLGYKVLGRVPYTIPLSWFYMGFASYIIGNALARRLDVGRIAIWSVAAGVWLLTAWDLVLDPALAHESLSVQFWIWDEAGPYFGMPVKNFVGWSVTGLAFIGLSRLVWRDDPQPGKSELNFSAIVYLANIVFAVVLTASVSLWGPIVIALLTIVGPFALVKLSKNWNHRTSVPHVENA